MGYFTNNLNSTVILQSRNEFLMVVKHKATGVPCCDQGEGPGDETCSPMPRVGEKGLFSILSNNRNEILLWHGM